MKCFGGGGGRAGALDGEEVTVKDARSEEVGVITETFQQQLRIGGV